MANIENDSIKLVKKIADQLEKNQQSNIWLDFKPYPFAIYDREWVYLYTTTTVPTGFIAESGIYKGRWNQQFVGCTAIQYEGQLIAIWDQTLITPTKSFEELYSSILHEMFHCYQFEKSIFRMGNELQLVQYPFTAENIAARLLERKYLLQALFTDDSNEKKKLISTFISLREKRRGWIGEFLQYELRSESNEGTAVYVEYKTRQSVSELPTNYLLAHYGKDLVEPPNDFNTFRGSCLSSGLYIALLLEEIAPNWQQEYESSTLSLYDILLQHVDLLDVHLPTLDTKIATYIIEQDQQRREIAFQEFSNQNGYHITLRGEFKIVGIDPMNMLRFEDRILHRRFLKLRHNDHELFLSGLSVVHVQENLWTTDEVEFYTTELPKIDNEHITLSGIGDIYGRATEEGNHIIITL